MHIKISTPNKCLKKIHIISKNIFFKFKKVYAFTQIDNRANIIPSNIKTKITHIKNYQFFILKKIFILFWEK